MLWCALHCSVRAVLVSLFLFLGAGEIECSAHFEISKKIVCENVSSSQVLILLGKGRSNKSGGGFILLLEQESVFGAKKGCWKFSPFGGRKGELMLKAEEGRER